MRKIILILLICFTIFSCSTTKKKGVSKPAVNSNVFMHFKDMPNGFADVNFIIYKNNTFKISVFVLSDKSSASFDGGWRANKNNIELSFKKALSSEMLKNIFDPAQNKTNGINITINSYKNVVLPKNFSQIWLYNVLCGKK